MAIMTMMSMMMMMMMFIMLSMTSLQVPAYLIRRAKQHFQQLGDLDIFLIIARYDISQNQVHDVFDLTNSNGYIWISHVAPPEGGEEMEEEEKLGSGRSATEEDMSESQEMSLQSAELDPCAREISSGGADTRSEERGGRGWRVRGEGERGGREGRVRGEGCETRWKRRSTRGDEGEEPLMGLSLILLQIFSTSILDTYESSLKLDIELSSMLDDGEDD
eukprot:766798-Hanusia_phi.AAC.3